MRKDVILNQDKKHTNKCELRNFEAVAIRKYVSIQILSKHKEFCSQNGKCSKCDFFVRDTLSMKRHMRDQHEIMSSSTSPPLKRKKKVMEEEKDIETDLTEDQGLKDLSVS